MSSPMIVKCYWARLYASVAPPAIWTLLFSCGSPAGQGDERAEPFSIIPLSRSIRPFRKTRLAPAQTSFLTAVEKASTGCLLWLKAFVWSPNKPKAKAHHRPSDISTRIINCGQRHINLPGQYFWPCLLGGRRAAVAVLVLKER